MNLTISVSLVSCDQSSEMLLFYPPFITVNIGDDFPEYWHLSGKYGKREVNHGRFPVYEKIDTRSLGNQDKGATSQESTDCGCFCSNLTYYTAGVQQGDCKTRWLGEEWCFVDQANTSCSDLIAYVENNVIPNMPWSFEACSKHNNVEKECKNISNSHILYRQGEAWILGEIFKTDDVLESYQFKDCPQSGNWNVYNKSKTVSVKVIYHGKHSCEKEEKDVNHKLYDFLITGTVCLTVIVIFIITVLVLVKQNKKREDNFHIDNKYYY